MNDSHEEDVRHWEPASIHLQKGDVLVSKKGILTKGGLTGKFQVVYRTKYLGDDCWEILGDKREYVDARETMRWER